MRNRKEPLVTQSKKADNRALNRRNVLLGTSTLVATATLTSRAFAQAQQAAPGTPTPTAPSGRKPNINAPAGFQQNWIPTVPGKNWFAYFRFYQSTEAYFDRSWPLPDFKQV
jgi:hypothetical protein